MYASAPRAPFTSTATILKLLLAFGIVIVTIGMILLFSDALARHSASPYLQLTVAGAIVLVMSFLSIKIFERL